MKLRGGKEKKKKKKAVQGEITLMDFSLRKKVGGSVVCNHTEYFKS